MPSRLHPSWAGAHLGHVHPRVSMRDADVVNLCHVAIGLEQLAHVIFDLPRCRAAGQQALRAEQCRVDGRGEATLVLLVPSRSGANSGNHQRWARRRENGAQ